MCKVQGCNNVPDQSRRGYCQKHYSQFLASGRLRRKSIPSRGCKVEGCKRKHDAHGYCSIHRQRWQRFGDPLRENVIAGKGAPDKFIAQAIKYRGRQCLIWPYCRDNHGYARVSRNKKPVIVQRIVCIAVHGKPPSKWHIAAHSCGNGHLGCVNPMHLRWATREEDRDDMVKHGRSSNQYGVC